MATNQERDWAPDPDATTATNRPTVVRPAEPPVDVTGAPAVTTVVAAPIAEARVRWGAVWAGLLTALTAFVLFSLLGLAIGLTSLNAGTVMATGKAPGDVARNSAVWLGCSGIVAFFIGGYVAGRTATVFTRGRAALHGSMIFFLAVPLLVWFASQGVSNNLGNLGTAIHQNLGLVQTASTGAAARTAAWWTLIGLVVALVASALGGAFGARAPRR